LGSISARGGPILVAGRLALCIRGEAIDEAGGKDAPALPDLADIIPEPAAPDRERPDNVRNKYNSLTQRDCELSDAAPFARSARTFPFPAEGGVVASDLSPSTKYDLSVSLRLFEQIWNFPGD
jgi:hypothetical protein